MKRLLIEFSAWLSQLRSKLFRALCKDDYEHLQHLIDDVILLECENRRLRVKLSNKGKEG